MNFETIAIRHQNPRSQAREHSTALHPTSSFLFENAEHMRATFAGETGDNIYSRFTNPSVRELEEKIARLEGVEDAFATASGMSAVFASLMAFLKAGDHILASRAIFGSSFNVISKWLPNWNIDFDFVDPDDSDSWSEKVKPTTKMLFLETPTNPGLDILDLAFAGQFCKKHNILLNVDNCFATPYLQQPARFGADLITHSATKYIDGQGRVLGGLIAGKKELVDAARQFCRATGPSLSPFNAWILSKSLETLAVRMDRHCENALQVAQFLEKHPLVESVRYPFLKSHPKHSTALKQMRKGGGIVTFSIKNGLGAGRKFLDALQLFSLTANLGDTRSIATHPASTTHAKLTAAARQEAGISDGLIRLSIGLESVEDLRTDIEQALQKSQVHARASAHSRQAIV